MSAVVVTFDREKDLLETVNCLVNQHYLAYDITIVDQNPEALPLVEAVLRASGKKFKIVHLRPPHTVLARNLGAQNCTGDVVLFVDDDTRFGNDLVAAHAMCYRRSAVGAVGGWIESHHAEEIWKPQGGTSSSVRGANMSFRREALLAVRGFDTRLNGVPSYGEERDLCHAIRKAGYEVLVSRDALLFHKKSAHGGQRVLHEPKYWRSYTANYALLFLKTKHPLLWALFPFWLLLVLRRQAKRHSRGVCTEKIFWAGVTEAVRKFFRRTTPTGKLSGLPLQTPYSATIRAEYQGLA